MFILDVKKNVTLYWCYTYFDPMISAQISTKGPDLEEYRMPQTVWTFNLRPKRLKIIGQNFYCAFRYLTWSAQPFETA